MNYQEFIEEMKQAMEQELGGQLSGRDKNGSGLQRTGENRCNVNFPKN